MTILLISKDYFLEKMDLELSIKIIKNELIISFPIKIKQNKFENFFQNLGRSPYEKISCSGIHFGMGFYGNCVISESLT